MFNFLRRKTNFYKDKNEVKESRKEITSPSGRYKLQIRYYKTKDGCWNYSRGIVRRISDDKLICDIKRNYSVFSHSFVIKDNQEYLITGIKYISQTIVNLDTGKEFSPKEKHDGSSFCWIKCSLSPDEKTLMVSGCCWAAPYEQRFFDFTDPSKGWKQLEIKCDEEIKAKDYNYIEADFYKEPEWIDRNVVKCYTTEKFYLPLEKYEDDISFEELDKIPDEEYDDIKNWRIDEQIRKTLRRSEDKMIITEIWVSGRENKRRAKAEEYWRKEREWEKNFVSTDPLYMKMLSVLDDLGIDGTKSWVNGGGEKWARVEFFGKKKYSYPRAQLEWTVEPKKENLKVVLISDVKKYAEKEKCEFVRTEEGMFEALSLIKYFMNKNK